MIRIIERIQIMWRDRGKSPERIVFEALGDGSEMAAAQIVKSKSIGCGTLYPLLLNWERIGMLESRWGDGEYPRPRYYKLTAKGLALASASESFYQSD